MSEIPAISVTFVQALTSDSSAAQSVKKIPKIQLLFRQKSPCFAHC